MKNKNSYNTTTGLFSTFEQHKHIAKDWEEQMFFPKASYSKNHLRLIPEAEDHRLPYKRDVDRIIHSKAYTRYIDKTQVVYLVHNDHVTHRGLHVQLVSNFARGIATVLRLNLDLVEAIALGHDVGHCPFGHEGEGYLSELSQEYENGVFAHPWQSCRLFADIEPLNLGLAVVDGFLCHDGGMCGNLLYPRYGKSWDDHFVDKESKLLYPNKNILPGTLEGCLVKICDTMSYIGRDIEDAISLGIITRNQIPQTILGYSNSDLLTTLAKDIVQDSYEKEYIAMSEEVYEALKVLRKFNFEHIYTDPRLKVASTKIKRCYRILFEILLEDFKNKNHESYIWKNFLLNKNSNYTNELSPVRAVVDYISGMTDTFFLRTLENLIMPTKIELA